MNLRRFSFIILLLSSFFLLFLLFSTSPKTAFACDPPGSACSDCSGTCASDGSTCAWGYNYCVWDPNGNYCGGCSYYTDNCGSCPSSGCSVTGCPGPSRNANYCCGSYVCNNEVTYVCAFDDACARFSNEVVHKDYCPYGCSDSTNDCIPAPAPSCNYNRSYNQCCGTGLSQNVQEYTYSDGSGVCNYVVGACNQADSGCGGATPPPSATCNYNRTYNQCCATGLSERVDEYVWSNGSGACNYVVGACNQSDPACGGAPPPGPGAYCGDSSCNNGETCSSCSSDCGACTGVSCNTDVSLAVSPNPANVNSTVNFSVVSGDASTFLGDSWTGGVTGCGGVAWNSINCTANASGTFQWSHTWKHCEGSFSNCSSTCSKSINFTINAIIPPAPTGLSASCPAPGNTASLSWNSVAGATYYDVWYDATGKNNITGTSTSISGFNPGSGHTWGVRACNSSGCSGWSSTGSFTCTAVVPPTPTISTPSCIFSGYNGSGVTISWGATTPSVTYVDISTASDFSSYSNKAVAGTSTTAPAGFSGGLTLNPATPYYVRTWNGFLHSNTATFSIRLCVPAAPTTLNASCPAPGTTASLSWNSVAGATYYDVSYDASFKYNIVGTSTTIAGFTPGSGHTWGVRACNSSGCSGWSVSSSFTCVPAAPTGLSAACPTPGSSASLSWNASPGATYYALRVDNKADGWDGSCTSPAGDFCSNETGTSRTFSSTPGASYSWWVHACNSGAGCSSPTYGTSFTCVLPPCPGGLGACGNYIPTPSSIGVCSGAWAYNPGPSLAYNIWCAANANPTRGYCYQCNTNITPWIQTTGDVHSNEGINAPGGP